ncbi:MGMT family protein [Marinomonas sp. TW1]|uniref:MGMT family protein n=1 Tax=Marinomonas sp. TW1 TaxID=1561203 RepID=UPI0022B24A1E|nr:MGMT family protein [Marinomonas sp. TW1]
MTNQAMTHFKSQVFLILHQSQTGECFSYGEIAKLAGFPGYARQVGQLLKKLPKDTKLPWYRVVNAQKRISFAEGTDAYIRQKEKLESEGWVVNGNKLTLNDPT